jgi:hypothetical protein
MCSLPNAFETTICQKSSMGERTSVIVLSPYAMTFVTGESFSELLHRPVRGNLRSSFRA